jgi:hypothetical protein
MFTKVVDAFSAEDTENLTLLTGELWRGFATEYGQLFSQEGCNTRETEMC